VFAGSVDCVCHEWVGWGLPLGVGGAGCWPVPPASGWGWLVLVPCVLGCGVGGVVSVRVAGVGWVGPGLGEGMGVGSSGCPVWRVPCLGVPVEVVVLGFGVGFGEAFPEGFGEGYGEGFADGFPVG